MKNKRQHFIPQFYLKQFFPGWVYRQGEQHPRGTKKTTNIAVQSYYYEKPGDDVLLPLDEFNSVIEKEAAPVIQKLISDSASIDQDDWITLSYFLANMQLRNPNYHKSLITSFRRDADQISELAEDMMRTFEEATPEETLRKAQQILRAATGPANPSSADIRVAMQAQQLAAETHRELAQEQLEDTPLSSPL